MFQLTLLQETVLIMPSEFGKEIVSAVTDSLNKKYPNKVSCNIHALSSEGLPLVLPL